MIRNEKLTGYELGDGFYYYDVSAGSTLADHEHPYDETYWIMEGRGTVTIDAEVQDFDGPSEVHVPANVHHVFFTETQVRFFERRHIQPE